MATKTISQRIALTGSEEIRKQLAALGEWGEKAFRDIQAAAGKLKGPGAEFARNMDAARKRVRELGQEFDKVGTKVRNFGAGVSVGVTAPFVLAAKQSITAWNEQVDAIQKVEAALASTKGISKQTSEGLQAMASDLQRVTTFGGEAVLSMQAVLLTFTNIRGVRFEQATKAILNVATALGMDLQGAALQVGKALNDPKLGITALSRAGIQFTDVQKSNIRQMVEMGDVAGAQGVILKELETQFGGIAEAMAKIPTGQWTVAMNALGDALEQIGAIITPYITQLAAAIRQAALAFQALPENARTTIVVFAGLAAVLGPILVSLGFMVQGIGALATGFAGIMGVAATLTGALAGLAGGWNVVLAAMRGVLALASGMLSWPVALGVAFGVLAVTVAQHWDAIVQATADALDSVQQAAQSATESIRDWFGSAFDWIGDKIRGVLEWAMEKLRAIQSLMQSVMGGGGSGGGAGATGFARGGRVRGPGTSTSDSILARLSTGEFVIRARAVQHYGAEVFERLNAMRMPRTLVPGFAGGGLVVPMPAEAGGGAAHATVNLTIGSETFRGLMAPRETAERLIRFATAEESKKAGRRPAWFEGG